MVLIGLLSLSLGGCQPEPPAWLDPLPTITAAADPSPDQLCAVYFTAPSNEDFRGGPDRFLVDALDQARSQVDAALYDLNL